MDPDLINPFNQSHLTSLRLTSGAHGHVHGGLRAEVDALHARALRVGGVGAAQARQVHAVLCAQGKAQYLGHSKHSFSWMLV